ncbi:DUF3179 domain-containing protein [bacterium]|jgi:hypothetical protein|nr:DUF3179 domain-containing protein [bacterium]MBT3729949.1 DUF3179 domain-containing protein [bacterium]MBT4894839.1 DUF3179 domain-containing protein [bacterium]
MKFPIIVLIIIVIGVGFLFYKSRGQFPIPEGDSVEVFVEEESQGLPKITDEQKNILESKENNMNKSSRTILETDGIQHSIPLNEILSGGPGKDGIPSIDNPKFISVKDADEYLKDTDVGLGLVLNGVERFYPYQVLVWHEIVNDNIANERVLVTYCPLCATGIVFDPKVGGVPQEFGVSGKLWQSNLLMYNRTAIEEDESLWSQVLGEAVLGVSTGQKLKVLPADTVQYGPWKKAHPNTEILSRETGAIRSYGRDPYGDYYTDESVSFGATFNDDRLHPKAFVLGIEIDSEFKAYHQDALKVGNTKDTFAGKNIEINRDEAGIVEMTSDSEPIPHIDGFWFSWLAVHPETELLK